MAGFVRAYLCRFKRQQWAPWALYRSFSTPCNRLQPLRGPLCPTSLAGSTGPPLALMGVAKWSMMQAGPPRSERGHPAAAPQLQPTSLRHATQGSGVPLQHSGAVCAHARCTAQVVGGCDAAGGGGSGSGEARGCLRCGTVSCAWAASTLPHPYSLTEGRCRVVLGQCARARSAAQVVGGCDGAVGWRRRWCRGACDAALPAMLGLVVEWPTHPHSLRESSGW